MKKNPQDPRSFAERVKDGFVKGRAAKKELKEKGIVELPNGSVIVRADKTLADFGKRVVG